MSTAYTRTGHYPIGFRRLNVVWQNDPEAAIRFARENGFASIDVGPLAPDELRKIVAAGLTIGSVDLLRPWADLASPDGERRSAAARANADYIRAAFDAVGVRTFFAVPVVAEEARPRKENFEFAADGYRLLARAIEPMGVRVALEGWPGAPPYFATVACTPADCRAFFGAVDSNSVGINFDPSHLVRMGIDPVRFVHEFGPRIFHVHAKDTELIEEERYDLGTLQQPTFAPPRRWGGPGWRYALPGHGAVRWTHLLTHLHRTGYDGPVSIELEDENFNGTEEGERRGLIAAREFLENA